MRQIALLTTTTRTVYYSTVLVVAVAVLTTLSYTSAFVFAPKYNCITNQATPNQNSGGDKKKNPLQNPKKIASVRGAIETSINMAEGIDEQRAKVRIWYLNLVAMELQDRWALW